MTETPPSGSGPLSDGPVTPTARSPAKTAGAMIREMRERRGIHIGIVATTLKVPVRRLEALEADRLDEFPNRALVRALALSVCRALKTDPTPVLAALPNAEAGTVELAEVTNRSMGGFAQPAARGGSTAPRSAAAKFSPALVWGAGALVVAAGLALWWPQDSPRSLMLDRAASAPPQPPAPPAAGSDATPAPDTASSGASLGASATTSAATSSAASSAEPAARLAAQVPASAPAGGASPPATAQARTVPLSDVSGMNVLTASAPSWIEAVDSQQKVVLSRILGAGETVALEGTGPWRLVIGNAAGTQVRSRGRTVDLTPHTRDNVARIELN